MHRIGIISDTHGLLREEVKKELQSCDAILHGGDIHKKAVLEELQKIAPLYAVRGNADKEWAEHLPTILEIELFGIRIVMIHNKKELPEKLSHVDLLVFGHSHKYTDRVEGGIRLLNPGSCGPRRFRQPITMAVMEIEENGDYEIRRVDILHENRERNLEKLDENFENPEDNLKMPENKKDSSRLIKAVIKDVDKGKPVEKIAENNGISHELAEQICRMYLTHPGIDVDGILNRING